jgi:hypothetical protein
VRRPLALLAGAASDVRESVRRARARRRFQTSDATARSSAAEVKRRLDETHRRLKSEIPPPPGDSF